MGTRSESLYNTPWRQTATALFRTPVDGRIYGTYELDMTEVIRFVEDSKRRGVHITITGIFTSCLGRVLAFDIPELNCFVHRGRVVPRKEVSVLVVVTQSEGQDLGAVKIRNAHLKTASQITREIHVQAKESRAGHESQVLQNKQMLARIPWPFRVWFVRFVRWLFVEMGIELKPLGLSHSAFGSVLLTSIGTFGLQFAMPALFPFGKLPAALVLGEAEEKPVVRDGEIVIRTMIPVTATMDHRIVDGVLAQKLVQSVLRRLSDAAALDQIPDMQAGSVR
jgi:pyruvate/2-oxoglutarate dehydrogenase complex dihydrolipoamide acyltransferase (E2) component